MQVKGKMTGVEGKVRREEENFELRREMENPVQLIIEEMTEMQKMLDQVKGDMIRKGKRKM